MAINNGLYPPIIETFLPSFVGDNCNVLFALSSYQDILPEKSTVYAQMTVVDSKTNKNLLSTTKYPMGIKRQKINILSNADDSSERYYITLNSTDLKSEKFSTDTLYKIQLRLDAITSSSVNYNDPEQMQQFSEWSTACLVQKILSPKLTLNNLIADSAVELDSTVVQVLGKMNFVPDEDGNAASAEYLKQYQLFLYKNGTELIESSPILYGDKYNDPNSINYTFKTEAKTSTPYSITIVYTTSGLFTREESYNFSVKPNSGEPIDCNIYVENDDRNGRNKIFLYSEERFTGKYIISRSSYVSNFSQWEELFTLNISNSDWNKQTDTPSPQIITSESVFGSVKVLDKNYKNTFVWYDYTIESGVAYQYRVQKILSPVKKSKNLYSDEDNPIINLFDDIFLLGEEGSLRLKLNAQVSSFKYTIPETKLETIGGQYPFIQRNAAVKYRQFPINGLISSLNDDDEIFINKSMLLKGVSNKNLYEQYNTRKGIKNFNDFYYERIYRETVLDFLQNGKPKLFRALTEGNILVRLMDISLTPFNVGNRLMYNFSATAIEIGSADISTLNYYNIISTEKTPNELYYSYMITQDERNIITEDEKNILAAREKE